MIDAKRKAMIFLFLAFVLALVTAWFITDQVSEAQQVMGQAVKVAVAKKDVPANVEITSDMIDWIDIPTSSDLSSLITDEKSLTGQLSMVNLNKGDLFTTNIVRSRVDIPSDHRVVWLNPTENVIMDQAIYIGDKVDIIASFQSDSETVTKRILENIYVIQSEDVSQGSDDEQRSTLALKVSLSVPQAEQLIHMQNTATQVRVLRVNQVGLTEGINGGESGQTEDTQSAEQSNNQSNGQAEKEQQQQDESEERSENKDQDTEDDEDENKD